MSDQRSCEFFVPGVARPKGSMKPMVSKSTGRPFNQPCGHKNLGSWMADVKAFAMKRWWGPPSTGPIALTLTFRIQRPKYHYGTGRNAGVLKDRYVGAWPITQPDRDKLERAVCDALTKVVWVDDSQVVTGPTEKRYSERPGVHVVVRELNGEVAVTKHYEKKRIAVR